MDELEDEARRDDLELRAIVILINAHTAHGDALAAEIMRGRLRRQEGKEGRE